MHVGPLQLQQDSARAQLPHASAVLVLRATEIVRRAAALLADREASLLAVALTPTELASARAVVILGGSMTPSPAPVCGVDERSARPDRIGLAAAAVFKELLPRWPSYALPSRLGMISDGTGIGFSPLDPWPLAPGWLARHTAGHSTLVELVPFSRGGSWNLLTCPPEGGRH